jgi:hypothetical protein
VQQPVDNLTSFVPQDFEPYIVVQRKKLPAYDERLRGYFENKAVHCRHLATLGYGLPRRTAAIFVTYRRWADASGMSGISPQRGPQMSTDSCSGARRMKFAVHPTEFVVHLPHKESAARLMIIDPANAALRDKAGLCCGRHQGCSARRACCRFTCALLKNSISGCSGIRISHV